MNIFQVNDVRSGARCGSDRSTNIPLGKKQGRVEMNISIDADIPSRRGAGRLAQVVFR